MPRQDSEFADFGSLEQAAYLRGSFIRFAMPLRS